MNPSSPINIKAYAASNNTSLLDIDLYLYNETILEDSISLDYFDFYVNGEFDHYRWNPNHEYAPMRNYTVKMRWFWNDALIDIDTVYTNATGDNPFDTGHTLTVSVFDQRSIPLSYSTVYIEGWGTESTGSDHKVSFSGLGNEEYHYRATKPDYRDRGFSVIEMTADAAVNYILDQISTVHQVKDARYTDQDMKSIYLPMMYVLLICILFGAFRYVSK